MGVGAFRATSFRYEANMEAAKTYDAYMESVDHAADIRDLIRAYGPSVVTKAAHNLYTLGFMPYVSAIVRDFIYNTDCRYLMDVVSGASYTATMVALACATIDSKYYGDVHFDAP